MKQGMKKVLLLLLAATLLMTACGGGDNSDSTETGTQNSEAVNIVQDTQQDGQTDATQPEGNENLLTGLYDLSDEAVGKRPVAIMINNVTEALPQYGIEAADVIFEVPVEGGLSRMMAIYGDYTQVPKVCSVRSCRKYFPELAEGFDAIYVCSGMQDGVRNYVKSIGVTLYEGTYDDGTLFGRDQDRRNAGYSMEHTMYFDGTAFVDKLTKDGTRVDIEESKKDTAFTFVEYGKTVVPTGEACKAVKVSFGAMSATLRYDEATNTYLKEHNGNAQMDSSTNVQLAFTNVIIMETTVGTDTNGEHKTIDWYGGDDSIAYYISNGHVQKIHYKKDSIESRLVFYDESGNELTLNRGKTYIAINSVGKTTFE